MRQTIASLAKDDYTAYIQLKMKSSGKRGVGGKVKGEQGEQDEGLGLMTLSDEELKTLQVGLGSSHTYQRVIAMTKALYSAENDKGSLLCRTHPLRRECHLFTHRFRIPDQTV